jgi:hypothetical protein
LNPTALTPRMWRPFVKGYWGRHSDSIERDACEQIPLFFTSLQAAWI